MPSRSAKVSAETDRNIYFSSFQEYISRWISCGCSCFFSTFSGLVPLLIFVPFCGGVGLYRLPNLKMLTVCRVYGSVEGGINLDKESVQGFIMEYMRYWTTLLNFNRRVEYITSPFPFWCDRNLWCPITALSTDEIRLVEISDDWYLWGLKLVDLGSFRGLVACFLEVSRRSECKHDLITCKHSRWNYSARSIRCPTNWNFKWLGSWVFLSW